MHCRRGASEPMLSVGNCFSSQLGFGFIRTELRALSHEQQKHRTPPCSHKRSWWSYLHSLIKPCFVMVKHLDVRKRWHVLCILSKFSQYIQIHLSPTPDPGGLTVSIKENEKHTINSEVNELKYCRNLHISQRKTGTHCHCNFLLLGEQGGSRITPIK